MLSGGLRGTGDANFSRLYLTVVRFGLESRKVVRPNCKCRPVGEQCAVNIDVNRELGIDRNRGWWARRIDPRRQVDPPAKDRKIVPSDAAGEEPEIAWYSLSQEISRIPSASSRITLTVMPPVAWGSGTDVVTGKMTGFGESEVVVDAAVVGEIVMTVSCPSGNVVVIGVVTAVGNVRVPCSPKMIVTPSEVLV